MKLIESKTLGSAQANIEFTSIPATFTDLVVLISGRATTASTTENLNLRFNDSTSGYSSRLLIGIPSGGNASSSSSTGDKMNWASMLSGATSSSNTFGNGELYIPNYAASTNKSVSSTSVSEDNSVSTFLFLTAGLWSNTAAITKITLFPDSNNLAAGTTVSLYGVLKGSDGIVTTSP